MSIRLGSNEYFDSRAKKIQSINKIGAHKLEGFEMFCAKVTMALRNIFVFWRKNGDWKDDVHNEVKALRLENSKDYNKRIDDHVTKIIQDVQQDAFNAFMEKIPKFKNQLLEFLETSECSFEMREHINSIIDAQKKEKACEAFAFVVPLMENNPELIDEIKWIKDNVANLQKAMKNWEANSADVEYLNPNGKMIPIAREWASKMKTQKQSYVTMLQTIDRNYTFEKHGFFQDRINEAKRISQTQEKELDSLDLSFANYLIDKTNELLAPVVLDLKKERADTITLNAQQLKETEKDLGRYTDIKDVNRLKQNKAIYEKKEEIYQKYWNATLEKEVVRNAKTVKKITKKINKSYSKENVDKLASIYVDSIKHRNGINTELTIYKVKHGIESLAMADNATRTKLDVTHKSKVNCDKVIAQCEKMIKALTLVIARMANLKKTEQTDIKFEEFSFTEIQEWCQVLLQRYEDAKTQAEVRLAVLGVNEADAQCRAFEQNAGVPDLSTKAGCEQAVTQAKVGIDAFTKLITPLALIPNRAAFPSEGGRTFEDLLVEGKAKLAAYETAKVNAEQQKTLLEAYELLTVARAADQQNPIAEPATIAECNTAMTQAKTRLDAFKELALKLDAIQSYKDKFNSSNDTYQQVQEWARTQGSVYAEIHKTAEQQKLILECYDLMKACQAVPVFIPAFDLSTKAKCDEQIDEVQKRLVPFQKLVTEMSKVKEAYRGKFIYGDAPFEAVQEWSTEQLKIFSVAKETAEQKKIILESKELIKPCLVINPLFITGDSTKEECDEVIKQAPTAIATYQKLLTSMNRIKQEYKVQFKIEIDEIEYTFEDMVKRTSELMQGWQEASRQAKERLDILPYLEESLKEAKKHAAAEEEDKLFLAELRRKFDLKEIRGDGNCFFHTIKAGLDILKEPRLDEFTALSAEELRVRLYEHMKLHPDVIKDELARSLLADFNDYAVMSDDKANTWIEQQAPALRQTFRDFRSKKLSEDDLSKYLNATSMVETYANAMADNKIFVGLNEAFTMAHMLGIQLEIHSKYLPNESEVYGVNLPAIHIYRPTSNAHFELLVKRKGS